RFNGAQDLQTCNQNYLNHIANSSFDFYKVIAPNHPDLPGGGGYTISGLSPDATALGGGQPSAVTIMDVLAYNWNGVDTNFVWRGTNKWGLRGLRVNGGTSTGR